MEYCVVLQVPYECANPAEKGLIYWVDHMVNSYDLIFVYA